MKKHIIHQISIYIDTKNFKFHIFLYFDSISIRKYKVQALSAPKKHFFFFLLSPALQESLQKSSIPYGLSKSTYRVNTKRTS